MAEIKTNSSDISAGSDNKRLKVNSSPNIFLQYHASEIKQNESIINSAIKMIWVGVILIVIVSITALWRDSGTTLLVGASGVFIDLFGATIIHLADKSADNKQKNLENISGLEHEQRIMEFIRQTDSHDEFQCEMVSKIVDSHCSNKK